jgi:isoleucyl-tRNA synthetase
MKSINVAVTEMSQEQIAQLEANGNITLNVEGVDAVIETSDVEIYSEDVPGWTVANEGALTVALDVEVTEELRQEGIAREIVKKIQTMRKECGLDIVDRIAVCVTKSSAGDQAVEKFSEYIRNQVLADSLTLVDSLENGEEVELDGASISVSIVKA